MKVFLDYEVNNSGKGQFLQRLGPELQKLGISLVRYNEGVDAALYLTKIRGKKIKNVPSIIRIDGISLEKTRRNVWKGKDLVLKGMNKCDAIVYQSEFCRTVIGGILRPKTKNQFVIFNGDDPMVYDYTKRDNKEKVILMCARWYSREERLWKRRKEMTALVAEYLQKRKDVVLKIAGYIKYGFVKNNRIIYLGELSPIELRAQYETSNCVLHLSHPDPCPNSVVEAICAGLPVISTSNNGASELVKESGGIVLPLDEPLKPKWIKDGHWPIPLKIKDKKVIFDALDLALSGELKISNDHVNIRNIALKYKEVFESVL